MNEQTIEYRLDQIDKKLDVVTDLLVKTNTQELRIQSLEGKVTTIENGKGKSLDRWLNPLVSAVVSGIVAFIFIKVGMK